MSLDRVQGNEIVATQEQIADMLGVRRGGASESALRLEGLGLVRYGRGRIIALDREGLERQACECYAVVKKEYDRLLPETMATDLRPAVCRPWTTSGHGCQNGEGSRAGGDWRSLAPARLVHRRRHATADDQAPGHDRDGKAESATAKQFLPDLFAEYSARSADNMSDSLVVPCRGNSAMPMLRLDSKLTCPN